MVYLKSVENVTTLGKLIGPLLLFCLPLLSILFLNDLARPVMGTIFLVIYIYHAKSRLNTPVWGSLRSPNNWASEASPTLGCSIEISRGMSVGMYVCRMSNHVESRESNTRML